MQVRPLSGTRVNNKDLFSVKVLRKTLNTAYKDTLHCFVFGTWYICSISLDMKCLSDVPRLLGGARGQ